MIKQIVLMMVILLGGAACQQKDNSLVVVSLGGVHAKAQQVAFYGPFEQLTGSNIVADTYNGEMAKIRSMIETRSISWDIVQVESANLIRGCSEGLFEPLNSAVLGNVSDFIPDNFSECGVGFFSWSIVVAYNNDKFKQGPQGWKDFWDVKHFPGKRGLQSNPMIALEAALLADGVSAGDVYAVLATKQGQDRAFKKLDELKPYIVWWHKGSQPIPMLLAGDVVMTTSYSGRAVIAEKEGRPVAIVWNGSFYDTDNFAIVKGSPHKALAEQFIAFALAAPAQKVFSEYSEYGFVNNAVVSMIKPQLLRRLSNNPVYMQQAHRIKASFWVEQGEHLQRRFNAWAAQ